MLVETPFSWCHEVQDRIDFSKKFRKFHGDTNDFTEVAMFFRKKKSGKREYLQIVENRWENGKTRQQVVATLGRLDQLQEDGKLEALLQSGARFSERVMVLNAHRKGDAPEVRTTRIGPTIVFQRLWEQLHIPDVIRQLLEGRRFTIPIERILFLTVLHRLCGGGSDRSCVEIWKKDYDIPGSEDVALHQAYRAMGWLGEALPEDQQNDATPFGPRCRKDTFEEALFARRRDLFSELELVFFDTTSIYFEGEGGSERDSTDTARIIARTVNKWWSEW